MTKLLNGVHGIISISQKAIPDHLKGHTLIFHLLERDMIALAGWGDNTVLLAELIMEYMELSPCDQERVANRRCDIEFPGETVKIWQVLDRIYQERNSHKK